jgi:hypothetical protein
MDYEINNLHQLFTNLFNKLTSNNSIINYEKDGESMISEIGLSDNPIIFNYNFDKEIDYGFIEYKRTLIYHNFKKSKLLRQIYWRISEYSIYNNDDNNYDNDDNNDDNNDNNDDNNDDYNYNLCYYIIGLENSGVYSNINTNELQNSLDIIKKTICNTNINYEHIFLFNKNNNAYILLVKLYIENINYLNYSF